MASRSPASDDRDPLGLEELLWCEMNRPGCYVLIDSGDLVRVSPEGLTAGTMPAIMLVSRRPLRVARISNNPTEALAVLRALASQNGYVTSF